MNDAIRLSPTKMANYPDGLNEIVIGEYDIFVTALRIARLFRRAATGAPSAAKGSYAGRG
jgi:hypothetical protein